MNRLIKKSNMILSLDEITTNANYLYSALEDLKYDRWSYSVGQPLLIWKSDDNKNVLIDGYHRIVEGIMVNNKTTYEVEYVEYDEEYKEYIDEYNPSIYEPLSSTDEFKGLEKVYDKENLKELRELIKEINE